MLNLIKLNPWKALGILIALLSAVAAIVAGCNIALSRAKQAGRDEVKAQWNAEKAGAAQASAAMTAALSEVFGKRDADLQTALAGLRATGQDINLTIEKETTNDPRYRSTDCSVTDGVLRGINTARSLSGSAPAASGGGAALPLGPATGGQDAGSVGAGGR